MRKSLHIILCISVFFAMHVVMMNLFELHDDYMIFTMLMYQSTCPTLVNTMGWHAWCTKIVLFQRNQYEFEV
jgi:type IV secretory pathway VirB3-like protein